MHIVSALNDDDLYRQPPFIAVDYRDEPAVYTVSTRLREAWVTDPALIQSATNTATNTNNPDVDIGTVIRAIQSITTTPASGSCSHGDEKGGKSPADALAAFRNADKNTLHTALRNAVYHNWNHVFWDVARFLRQDQEEKGRYEEGQTAERSMEAGGGHKASVGHLHPPAEGVFPLEYPERWGPGPSDEAGAAGLCDWTGGTTAMEREFETNVLVVPTFVEEGVKVGFAIGEGDEVRGFTFDATTTRGVYNEPVVYWIRKGEMVKISLSGDIEDRRGVAAVFVYGKLCDCSPENEVTPALESDETDTEEIMSSIEDEVLEEK
ncbi:hypothetical protein DBV05_g56 [Lasiodiplodia theobromae]|uniref:Uncharacterized protein n=1 Tax=Lasiodiplodia theobromae TaxID=45133 RepID=A0A5N5DW25_9PEZI|nr:hypothetical protein DBV05_g56 [Lasiodiplodia theobromae]